MPLTVVVGVLLSAGVAGCRRAPAPASPPLAKMGVPQRIVVFAPSTAEIVCALGAERRLVAVGQYCTYPPSLKKLMKIGGLRDPDLEALLTLRPDLVMIRGAQPNVEALCRRHAIRVYHDPTETLSDITRAVREIGGLLGVPDRAEQVVAEMNARLEGVRQAVAGLPRPRVLFTNRRPDRLADIYTVGQGSYLDELITLAGGVNVFGDQQVPYPLVGLEDIVTRRPEVIVESLFGQADGPELRRRVLAQWKAVGPLPAAETGRIYILAADYATVPSPRVVRMAEHLATLFHPQVRFGQH